MTTIKLKNGSGAPTAGDLAQGEPALDLTNKRLYTEDSGGTVIEVGTNPGVDVTFADNRKAVFGDGSDLQIYHDGSHSRIVDAGTGNLSLQGNDLRIKNADASATYIQAANGGAVELAHNNNLKLATTATGIDVTGTVTADGLTVSTSGTNAEAYFDNGTQSYRLLNRSSDNAFSIFDNTASAFRLTTASNGDISFYDSSGTSQSLFWDASAGKLGVGTTTPNAPVDAQLSGGGGLPVSSGTAQTYGSLRVGATSFNTILDMGSAGASGAWLQASDKTGLGTNYSLLLNPNGGNVGIGTDSPQNLLHVQDSTGSPQIRIDNQGTASGIASLLFRSGGAGNPSSIIQSGGTSSGNQGIVFKHGDFGAEVERMRITSGGILEFNDNAVISVNDTADSMYIGGGGTVPNTIQNQASALHNWQIGGSNAMRLDASGNLLVGKTSAALAGAGTAILASGTHNVTVDGDTTLQLNRLTSDGAIATFFKDGLPVGQINARSGDLVIGTGTTGLQFYDVGNAIFPLSASGNTNRDAAIDLGEGSNRFKDLYLSGRVIANGVTTSAHAWSSESDSTSSSVHLYFRNPNGFVGNIATSGTATAYNTSSDYRLKENAVAITGATDRLKQLSPKRFNFIADADTTVDGFMAHEVQSVVPEAITGTHNEVDDEGNPVYQAIDQSKLVPLLVATIQELEARITALETN